MIRGLFSLTVLLKVLFYLDVSTNHVLSRHAPRVGTCALNYFKSMKAYDCAGINLSEVPQHLSSSTEILDVSFNRIRELKKTTFANYAHLSRLYLNDNMIMSIEVGTFDNLNKIQTIDLSMNALHDIPTSIFHVPTLQKLILSNNIRLNILNALNQAVPITAPLQLLDISFCPLLTQLPRFGVMLDLLHLNVTGNHITNVSTESIVGLCNLRWFSSENATLEFATACDCQRIDRWFTQLKVHSIPSFSTRCGFAKGKCTEQTELSSYNNTSHEQCKAEFQARENIKYIIRVCYIVFGVSGGIILLVAICFIYYRFQRLPDKDSSSHKKDIIREINNESLLKPNNND